MCEASAYVLRNGQEELLLSDVDIIEQDGDDLRLVNIFGEQTVIKADIQRLNLVNHKIILVEK
ncbi:MAG: CooT family nickel-binding protein [Desulfobacterales bacterium]|nr:CooT family nickel-binding protein [Pseudomonadota bacterium]MBU4354003.1 CooT family nickel-binding protein [Pseudomonadota bacterium]MCG2773326.1 CooT family nickel-binding protein [Desulfobacterales bacterium]